MSNSIIKSIQGSWLLVSMTYENNEGETIDLYGKDPLGIISYDASGYMNAQMGYRDRNNFVSGALSGGTVDEISQAYKSYMAYFGRYREDTPGVIIHEVEGCLFPNWRGNEEIRYAKLENEFLVLSTPPIQFGEGEIVIKAVWRRIYCY